MKAGLFDQFPFLTFPCGRGEVSHEEEERIRRRRRRLQAYPRPLVVTRTMGWTSDQRHESKGMQSCGPDEESCRRNRAG